MICSLLPFQSNPLNPGGRDGGMKGQCESVYSTATLQLLPWKDIDNNDATVKNP